MCKLVVFQIKSNHCKRLWFHHLLKPISLKPQYKKIIIYYDSNTSYNILVDVIYVKNKNKTKYNKLAGPELCIYNLLMPIVNLDKNITKHPLCSKSYFAFHSKVASIFSF